MRCVSLDFSNSVVLQTTGCTEIVIVPGSLQAPTGNASAGVQPGDGFVMRSPRGGEELSFLVNGTFGLGVNQTGLNAVGLVFVFYVRATSNRVA